MRKFLIVLFGLVIILLKYSCVEDDYTDLKVQEELLIEQIAAAPDVNAVFAQDLPIAISNYVQENHTPLEIELAFHAAPYGYEIFMENGLCLFFDRNGDHLDHDGIHGDEGNHHGGGDHGINFCMAGDTLEEANLPQSAIDFIMDKYFGETIVTVVLKPNGNLVAEISNGHILMFGSSGDYHHECNMQATGGHGHGHGNIGGPGWHCTPEGMMGGGHHGGPMRHGNHGGMDNHNGPNEHCWGGPSISIDNIPLSISEYITTQHSDASIEHIMQTFNSNYFLRLSTCVRLVFDHDGNLLFDSDN